MSSDIGQDILKSVRADFAKALDYQNSKLGKLFKKIQDGSATMSDISTFSVLIGQTVSSAVEKRITPDVLPDGTLYFNIAQTVLQGVLKDSYELINLAAQSVQERLDSEYGLHIKPVKPDFPEERIRDIAGAASTASMNKNEEKEERRLTSPVENVVQSFYSDYVRENADLRSKAGLNAYIIRRTNGRCCPWCSGLAGRYRYEDAPPDIYARHDNCTCTVDFVTDKYRQDVWNKRKYSLSPEERRKALEAAPKPTRYTREQAKNLQYSVMNRVAFSGGSGIIEVGSDSMAEITQLGRLNTQPLEREFGKLKTDEIIVTNERIEHIRLRHPEDYEFFEKYGVSTIEDPDLIVTDGKHDNTVFMVKRIDNSNLNVVAKLILDRDEKDYKNSVMTFYRIRNRNLKKLIDKDKNKVLYKKE